VTWRPYTTPRWAGIAAPNLRGLADEEARDCLEKSGVVAMGTAPVLTSRQGGGPGLPSKTIDENMKNGLEGRAHNLP